MDAEPGDPIGAAVEVLGDRWTLLVLRDIVFEDRRYFRALLTGSPERIASNILADRLKRLLDAGILVRGTAFRGQRARFSLTEAGIQSVPVLLALRDWGIDWRPGQRGAAAQSTTASVTQLMDDLRTRHREDETT